MGRGSKVVGGHMPLTHYERTHKFASSEYGTVAQRLSGESQYKLGDCALSLCSLEPAKATEATTSEALCTPSGYLYADDAILTYLLEQTKSLKEQRGVWERQQEQLEAAASVDANKKRKAEFSDSQTILGSSSGSKKKRPVDQAKADLKRVSYWLSDAQPDQVTPMVQEPLERPPSPHSQQPLRRKELWPVMLQWQRPQAGGTATLVCSVSEKALHAQPVVAYWTSSSEKQKYPGRLVLKDVYDRLIAPDGLCPQTSRKIKYTREVQRGGSSFARSGGQVHAKKYRPTIT
jgi:hypothetical protein